MFWNIFRFEIRYRLKRPATYVYFGIFLLFSIVILVNENVNIGMIPAAANVNAPYVLAVISAVFSAFGIMVTSAMMSTPIIRDYDHNTHHFIYSMPISKWQYLGGRFAGSMFMTIMVFMSIPIGMMIGIAADHIFEIHPGKLGAFSLWSYFQPFFLIVIPNIFFAGSLFFSLASLTKKMVYSYLGNVILLVGYIIALNLLSDIDNRSIGTLVDPFGLSSLDLMVRYWTISDFNTRIVSPDTYLLLNRLIWIGVGVVALLFVYRKFTFTTPKSVARKASVENGNNHERESIVLPRYQQSFSVLQELKLCIKQAWIYFKGIATDFAFIAIIIAGIGLVASGSISLGSMYDTNYYPVTYSMLQSVGGSFVLFVLIILTFFSGELVWKERSVKLNQIYDTLPVPSWVTYTSKYVAMLMVTILVQLVVMLTCVVIQISHSYYVFEFNQYFVQLFVIGFAKYAILLSLIMLIQVLSSNKFVGFVFVMVYYVVMSVLSQFGLEDGLLRPNAIPSYVYSDMNGYGPFLTSVVWFTIYWGVFAVILALISNLFWKRGSESGFKTSIRRAKERLGIRTVRVAFYSCIALFLGVGVFIYYNTHVLNDFETSKHREKKLVEFEKHYKWLEQKPQPKIVEADVSVDIYPHKSKLDISGTFFLKNNEMVAVDTVYVNLPTDKIAFGQFKLGSDSVSLVDDYFGIFKVALSNPLQPGDSLPLTFAYKYSDRGFVGSNPQTFLVDNGTFFNSKSLFPTIGYNREYEMSNKDKRKKYDLPEQKRMPLISDTAMWQNTYLGTDGSWIRFKATVSTSADQVAVAPGRLVKQWTNNDRNYYSYQVDGKMLNFFSFLSANYQVERESYKGIDLEVFYHKGHEYNIPNMFKAMKQSLDYFQENFGPFQHKNLRIVEFPRYASFAQSFPATIPYSESIGFIADLRDTLDIDYVFYVTAHEIAHQWWAHQVCGANVQGATLMSEALAQYSSLMVMEKEYGRDKMRKFLKHELDQYLSSRKFERIKEDPLYLNENQGYIHYNKGSVVMYGLRDYIGEENLNKALAKFDADWKFHEPPFPISTKFLEYINDATPDSLKYLIDDMFKTITLYSNRVVKATYAELPDGKYKVTVNVNAQKFRADEKGLETELTFDDYIDIGVLSKNGKDDKILYLQKHKVHVGENVFEIIVDQKPEIAGIDPMNKLIDRDSDDNRMSVEKV
ncbi:MAG: ABC transporter permease/M1 family aminopeptidase [Bacteroidales bacterium]